MKKIRSKSKEEQEREEIGQTVVDPPYVQCFGCIPMLSNSQQTRLQLITTNTNTNTVDQSTSNITNTNSNDHQSSKQSPSPHTTPHYDLFDARTRCWRRTYTYLIPQEILNTNRNRKKIRMNPEEVIEQLTSLGRQLEGTHNFHNFGNFKKLTREGEDDHDEENDQPQESRGNASRYFRYVVLLSHLLIGIHTSINQIDVVRSINIILIPL